MCVIAQREITKVKILDDDPNARQGTKFCIEDASFTPIPIEGPVDSLSELISSVTKCANAIVCDHHLSQGTYATFDGAEAVARFYKSNFPAILCTAWSKADIDSMRKYRQFIPSLIPTDKLDTDSIITGFEKCINEFSGKFLPSRKPWRTMLRVERVDIGSIPKMFYVILPGWNSMEIIRLPFDLVNPEVHEKLKAGARFHAHVNKGAENQDELYFRDIEFD